MDKFFSSSTFMNSLFSPTLNYFYLHNTSCWFMRGVIWRILYSSFRGVLYGGWCVDSLMRVGDCMNKPEPPTEGVGVDDIGAIEPRR